MNGEFVEPVKRSDLESLLLTLNTIFKPPYEAKVVVSGQLEGAFGDCTVKDGKAVIRIARGMPRSLALEVLAHEYAHLLSHDYHGRNHDAVWAVAYAEVYKLVMGDH